ncbi:MAG: SDR family oxidoreductase [Burkholderiales bacterium]|nr:SDR family oxidoreductase [Burkholderiales bacterium]
MKAAEARVLLTGARGGIGQAMARALLGAGVAVMGVGRATAPPALVASGMHWLQADLITAQGVADVATGAEAWGANVVVHAAGVPAFGPLANEPAWRLDEVVRTNLLAPMLLTRQMLPRLLARPRAQIVFVGSALGRIGLPGFSVYGASKSGLHGFAEALRRELGGSSVRVQVLAPRSTRTPFNDAAVEAYNRATSTAMDSPELVAQALLRLIESEAPERFIGFPERLAVRLNGALGALLDRSFVKHRRHLHAAPAAPDAQGSRT